MTPDMNTLPPGIEFEEYSRSDNGLVVIGCYRGVRFFSTIPRSASVTTLRRRAAYGGRKGRRALRRLRELGYIDAKDLAP